MRQTQRFRDDSVVDERLAMIASLASIQNKDTEEYREKRRQAALDNNVSERTIDRYYDNYKANGIAGLRRGHPKGAERKLDDATVKRGIQLLMENPRRSVSMICTILESEKHGHICRSTLQDAFEREGFTKRELRIYEATKDASTRFEKEDRNMLWMGDIKYGPEVMYNGVRTKTYLVAYIDDYSRFIVHAEFYPNMEVTITLDSFKKALYKYGKPEAVYYDNGTQFKNAWMEHACHELGIELRYAQPKHPYSKGKIEKFFGYVDEFLIENELHPAKTLNDLNITFQAWLLKCYTQKVHSVTKQTPEERYANGKKTQKFVDPAVLDHAFELEETRKVTKCGEISFKGVSFFPGLKWAGKTVTFRLDFSKPDVLRLIDEDGCIQEVRRTEISGFVQNYQKPSPTPINDPSNYLYNLVQEIYGLDLNEFHPIANTDEAAGTPADNQPATGLPKIDYTDIDKDV